MKRIDGVKFKEMLLGGAKALEINKDIIDELNVFPVPDGDTGLNMSLTVASAIREVNTDDTDVLCDVALLMSKGALKGARGNSGVILSQIWKGFAVAFDTKVEITAKDFALGLKKATEIAYGAVTKPKEGTILTVVRVMAEAASNIVRTKGIEFDDFLSQVIDAGEQILQKTPEMLPVLAKAGVVDAGGRGLMTILDGMYRTLMGQELVMLNGEKIKPIIAKTVLLTEDEKEFYDNDYSNITFAYCTEFFIINLKKETTTADIDAFRDYLMTIGDCVLVIGDVDLVKTHVHTNNPDIALKQALKLGELNAIKIENMVEQNRQLKGIKSEEPKEMKENAMISICSGDGMEAIFKDLQVDVTVEGGQTMNPSVYDILNAINSTNAKNIFVLPNNTNIILAANQAKELADANVYVVPTTDMPQGIAAALVFSELQSPDSNYINMEVASKSIATAEITYAVRSTRMNGFSVKENDIIGIYNKNIIAKSNSVHEVGLKVANRLAKGKDMLALYYGETVTEEEADALAKQIEDQNPDIEIATYYGGQAHYYYIISAE